MEHRITKLLKDVENGKMDRRHLMQVLGLGATAAFAASALSNGIAAFAASAAQAVTPGSLAPGVTPTATVHHASLRVADYAKSRDWYIDLFGMRDIWDDGKGAYVEFGPESEPNAFNVRPLGKPTDAPGVDHIAFGSWKFTTEMGAMKAALERGGATGIKADSALGWIGVDPAGYPLNPWCALHNKALYPGSAGTCEVVDSDACKAGYEAGTKNLGSVPKASGKGFKAIAFSHIIVRVPEAQIPKERDFYVGVFGMKVLSYKADGPDAGCVLGFGKNTMDLRKTANPNDKPYCNEYGFLLANYNAAKVKAELDRRGLNPTLDPKLGLVFKDPDGLKIWVTGKSV